MSSATLDSSQACEHDDEVQKEDSDLASVETPQAGAKATDAGAGLKESSTSSPRSPDAGVPKSTHSKVKAPAGGQAPCSLSSCRCRKHNDKIYRLKPLVLACIAGVFLKALALSVWKA